LKKWILIPSGKNKTKQQTGNRNEQQRNPADKKKETKIKKNNAHSS
jgi:hypothetical protein